VGPAKACAEQWGRHERAEQQGFTYVGFVDTGDQVSPDGLGGVSDLKRLLLELRADTILLCGQMDEATFTRVVKTALAAECQILSAARTLELSGLQPSILWRRGQPFVELRTVALRGQQLILKRLLDIVLSTALLIFFSPVLAVVAAAVRLGSDGPALFGQRRLGRHGRNFRCYKFRSMYVDAEHRLRTDPELYREYVRNDYKLPDGLDPRVTPIGRFLRKTSLDELPQLWNVIVGDMSLVGPRPIVVDEIRHYESDESLLLLLKPGITGAWQVNGRSTVAYPERSRMELDYVQSWSLVTDIRILLATAPAVLARRGAH
jgi:exopolysaccharide production protein ExoY